MTGFGSARSPHKKTIRTLLLALISFSAITAAAGAQSMVARWAMDDDAASSTVAAAVGGYHGTFHDASGNPHTSAHHSSDCREGTGSLIFDGVDDYVEVVGYQGITGTHSRTCSAWIKTSQSNAGEIISWGTDSPGQKWSVNVGSGTIRVFVYTGNAFGTTRIDDGQWHHIAVVLDDDGSPNTNEIKFYIDGVQDTLSSSSSYAVNTGDFYNVKLGAWSGIYGGFFKGLLDDVRIYDYALSDEEIREIAKSAYAYSPFPADKATGVGVDRNLSWLAGQYALSHDVYLGTSESQVANAQRFWGDIDGDGSVDISDLAILAQQWLTDPGAVNFSADIAFNQKVDLDDFAALAADWQRTPNPIFKGNQADVTYDPGPLQYNTTYYWRIDEVNPSHADSPWSSQVWSFKTKGDLLLSIPNLSPGAYTPVYDTLAVGSLVYADRTFTFSSVPSALQGETYIKTSNDDKQSTARSFLVFDVNQDCTIYVAHDTMIANKPAWLAAFTDTGEHLATSDSGKTFRLYRKDFIAGTITLGGNGGTSANSMYSVIVVGKGVVTPGGTYDLYSDTWVVRDALGRELPDYAQCGPQRDNRTTALFYFLWFGEHLSNGPYDITKLLAANPSNPAWGSEGWFHHWGESELGYYLSSDPWVMRKHAYMLAAADVDVIIFDVTNGWTYENNYKALCNVFMQIRSQGGKTPQIAFMANAHADQVVQNVYTQLYSQNLYRDLWFYWKGKPLILAPLHGMPVDAGTFYYPQTIRDFFSMRYSWTWMNISQPNVWKWMDWYPQQYGWHESSSIPEQLSVSLGIVPHGSGHGRSGWDYTRPPIDQYGLTGIEERGVFFAQQLSRLNQIDPELLFITGWNEWVAQRQVFKGDGTDRATRFLGKNMVPGDSWFIDLYNLEFSRDIEPMKGGYTDSYYYQMIDGIRKYKGVKQLPAPTATQTIAIDGDFADWLRVGPEYRDHRGDTAHRNWPGWGSAGRYTNTTGRNDIIAAKAARDDHYLYFYVETANAITSWIDPGGWMVLFINTDQDYTTGWEGYDYIVNLAVNSATSTTLKYTSSGWNWADVNTDIPYHVVGNKMELRIPRSDLGQGSGSGRVAFDFKWADNPQVNPEAPDIISFSIRGDSAPDRRANYRYDTAPWTLLTYADFETGWGSFIIGGSNCTRYINGYYAHQGIGAANIRNGTTSSQFTSNYLNVSAYSQIKIEFWYYTVSMEPGKNFRVEYDNGSGSFQTLATYTSGTHFNNNEFTRGQITINKGPYAFPTNARFRFRCYASDTGDDVYIDEVKITAR